MCENATRPRARAESRRDEGAAMIEYVMLLGFLTAIILTLLGWMYPGGGQDLESLVNRWGVVLSEQIAGDKMSKENIAEWKEN